MIALLLHVLVSTSPFIARQMRGGDVRTVLAALPEVAGTGRRLGGEVGHLLFLRHVHCLRPHASVPCFAQSQSQSQSQPLCGWRKFSCGSASVNFGTLPAPFGAPVEQMAPSPR